MKRKILIFALCCALLLGVFCTSVSASTSIESLEESNEFVFDEVINSLNSFAFSVVFDCNSNRYTLIDFYSNNGFVTITYHSQTGQKYTVYNSTDGWVHDLYRTIRPFSGRFKDYSVPNDVYSYLLEVGDFTVVHTHSYSSSVIAPTHTDKGYTLYTCDCGDTYKDNYVNALGHDYTITEKIDPSCTTKGYTTYVCDCGDTYTEEGASYGHTFTTTMVDPTCTRKGSKTYVCDCGYSYSEEIPTLPHTYSSSVVDPTCSRKGYTMYTCVCGYSYRDNYVDTIPHVFEGTRCSVCNALDPSYIIKSKDFSNVFVRLSEQIKVNSVVGVLCVAAAACVGLVFMWLGGRKLVRAIMSAFKKGKISL